MSSPLGQLWVTLLDTPPRGRVSNMFGFVGPTAVAWKVILNRVYPFILPSVLLSFCPDVLFNQSLVLGWGKDLYEVMCVRAGFFFGKIVSAFLHKSQIWEKTVSLDMGQNAPGQSDCRIFKSTLSQEKFTKCLIFDMFIQIHEVKSFSWA